MYFTNNQKVVESEAIASLHQFDLVTINGEQYVHALFKLDPAVRHYAEGDAPTYFALTDSINVRLLSPVGLPATEAPVAEVVAAAPEVPTEVAPEAPEAPAQPADAAPEAPEAPAQPEAPAEAPAAPAEAPAEPAQ